MEPESVSGFSRVEYLGVFNAFVFGFVIAEFFSGWGELLRRGGSWNGLQLVWSLETFLLAVLMWWGTWTNHLYIGLHIAYFYYGLALPLVLYVVTVFLFPRDAHGADLFNRNVPTLYALFAVLFTLLIANSYVFHEYAFFHPKNAFKGAAVILAALGLRFRGARYRTFFSVTMGIMLVAYVLEL